eukprot:gene3353-5900_t
MNKKKEKKRKLKNEEDKNKRTKAELQYKTKSNDELTLLTFDEKDENLKNQFPSIPLDMSGEQDVLDTFLYPLKKEDFLKDIYTKKCFATSNAPLKRFKNFMKNYMFSLDLDELLEETPTEGGIHIWMKNKEKVISSFQLEDLEKVKILQNCGASLYFRAPENLEEFFVKDISYGLGQNFAGYFIGQTESTQDEKRGEIETFISKKGHLTGWHIDFMENFTFQLSGIKKWTLKKSNVTEVQRGFTPHYKDQSNVEQQLKVFHHINPEFNSNPEEIKDEEVIILKPGDCLYFPSGHWHKVECLEDSISINVSLFSQKWSDMVCSAIHCLLNKDLKWRKGILINNETESKEYLSKLLEDLKEKIKLLKTNDIMPNSIFFPRDEHSEKKEDFKFDLNTNFRMNPISVLIKTNGKYVIHNNFGNEDVSSLIRIELNNSKG